MLVGALTLFALVIILTYYIIEIINSLILKSIAIGVLYITIYFTAYVELFVRNEARFEEDISLCSKLGVLISLPFMLGAMRSIEYIEDINLINKFVYRYNKNL